MMKLKHSQHILKDIEITAKNFLNITTGEKIYVIMK